jgi:hypothetical protein
MTIKDIVFKYIENTKGNVDFEELTALIMAKNPSSKWQLTHWSWYKTKIVSPKGKYYNQFSDLIRTNLSLNSPHISKNEQKYIKVNKSNLDIFKFPDNSTNIEKDIALALGKVCHHIHPQIVKKIVKENEQFRNEFKNVCGKLNYHDFLYDGSDCVFPGVRRCINKEKVERWKNNINNEDSTILNDNTFPRHIWAYLTMNKPYSGNMWGKSGLAAFELAHIFGHKVDEKSLEKKVFGFYDEKKTPYAYFTSASNVILIPNGLMKPTDKFESIKVAFYKRHIELYGEIFHAEVKFDYSCVPDWYYEIKWLEPLLPEDWEIKIENLLKYRKRYLFSKYE